MNSCIENIVSASKVVGSKTGIHIEVAGYEDIVNPISVVTIYKMIQVQIGMSFNEFKERFAGIKKTFVISNGINIGKDNKLYTIKRFFGGDIDRIVNILALNDIVYAVEFNQDLLYNANVQSSELSVFNKLTLGNSKDKWTKERAVRFISIILDEKQENFVSIERNNSISVKHKGTGIMYNFKVDKHGFMNMLAVVVNA